MKLKYDLNLMNYRTIFENVTRAKVKDCFLKDNVFLVIVQENEIGKAIGKNGANIKYLENKFCHSRLISIKYKFKLSLNIIVVRRILILKTKVYFLLSFLK